MEIGQGVENFLRKRLEDSEGLLVGLNSGGCTGLSVEFQKTPLKDITSQSIKICPKVFVRTESAEILSKCSLVTSDDPFSERLTVEVPKEMFYKCGCGESFSPRDTLDY